MKKRQLVCTCLLLIIIMALSGCKLDTSKLIHPSKDKKEQLIKVEIVFTDGETLVTYLKQLRLESDARIYVGGPSSNYYYDARGNVIGAFNYQRVLYIRLLPEGESNSGSG